MNINTSKILKQGEGISVEFKKNKNKLPETLFDTVCAFLNNCYVRKNNTYTENTIYPYLYEANFVPGIVERVRRQNIERYDDREYTNAYPSAFIIYSDRVETKNANRPHLYGQLILDNFEPFPKNPHIAKIFTNMGRSEELGTGLRKVYKYSKAYSGNDHIVFNEEDIFVQIIPFDQERVFDIADNYKNGPENGPEKGTENITKNQQLIIEKMVENPYITAPELSDIIGIARSEILENIAKLKSKGILERIGPDKGGYWKIINAK